MLPLHSVYWLLIDNNAQLHMQSLHLPGGRMASKVSAPYMPMLEMVKVPLLNSSGASFLARARLTRSAQLRLIWYMSVLSASCTHKCTVSLITQRQCSACIRTSPAQWQRQMAKNNMTTTDIAPHNLLGILNHMHAFHDLHALCFQAGNTTHNMTNAGITLLPQQHTCGGCAATTVYRECYFCCRKYDQDNMLHQPEQCMLLCLLSLTLSTGVIRPPSGMVTAMAMLMCSL